MSIDHYGRRWDLPKHELCADCGQPDNCGDCTHQMLSDGQALALGVATTKKESR